MSVSSWNEKWLGLLALIWGVAFCMPGDVFQRVPYYGKIAQYAPDTLWGLVMGVSGFFLFLPLPPAFHKHIHWILCTIWLMLGVIILLSGFFLITVLLSSQCLVISMIHAGNFWHISRTPAVHL